MSTLSFTTVVSALLLIATVLVAGQEPLIEIGITETHAHPGQNVTITCRAENQGSNAISLHKSFEKGQISLVYLNDELFIKPAESGRYKLTVHQLGASTKLYTLSITNTSKADSGAYTCTIRSINLKSDKEFYVYHPVEELSFNNVTVDHGFSVFKLNESSTLDLDCTAKGSIPAADIKMYVGDREITDEHTKKMTGTEIHCQALDATCIQHETFTKTAMIPDFRVSYKDHNKDLKCVATVPNLPPKEAVFKMLVPFSPKFECDLKQVAPLHSSNFKLSCVVLSNPGNPDFVWEFMWGGVQQELRNNEKTTDGEIRAGQTAHEDGRMEVYLQINKVSSRHFTAFSLKSNNSIGSNQAEITLASDPRYRIALPPDDTANAAATNSISAIFVLLLVLLRAHL